MSTRRAVVRERKDLLKIESEAHLTLISIYDVTISSQMVRYGQSGPNTNTITYFFTN
jgi:hypothetical protein